jgi:hypothetical protein
MMNKRVILVTILLLLPFLIYVLPNKANADYQTDLYDGMYIQSGSVAIDVGKFSVSVVFDWNADGMKDLLVGQNDANHGYVSYYQNVGTDSAPVFDGFTDLQSCTQTCSLLDVAAFG